MRLDVIYTCELCDAVSVDSVTVGVGRPDFSPICEHGHGHITSQMELHTRDEETS